MKRRFAELTIPTLAALTPAIALAASDHGDDHGAATDPPPLLDPATDLVAWTLILFVLVLGVLGKFVWPVISGALDERERKIRGEIEDAEAANAKAQAALADYEQKLAAAQAEVRQMIDDARADSEKMRQQRVAELEQELDDMRQRATEEIAAAKQSALQDLHAHAGELAVAVASKILQRQITDDDTQRLVDESLGELDDLKTAG